MSTMQKSDDQSPSAKVLVSQGIQSVSLIMFLDALASSLGVSVLPYYVEELGGTAAQFGVVLSTFAAVSLSGVDHRNPVLLLAQPWPLLVCPHAGRVEGCQEAAAKKLKAD